MRVRIGAYRRCSICTRRLVPPRSHADTHPRARVGARRAGWWAYIRRGRRVSRRAPVLAPISASLLVYRVCVHGDGDSVTYSLPHASPAAGRASDAPRSARTHARARGVGPARIPAQAFYVPTSPPRHARATAPPTPEPNAIQPVRTKLNYIQRVPFSPHFHAFTTRVPRRTPLMPNAVQSARSMQNYIQRAPFSPHFDAFILPIRSKGGGLRAVVELFWSIRVRVRLDETACLPAHPPIYISILIYHAPRSARTHPTPSQARVPRRTPLNASSPPDDANHIRSAPFSASFHPSSSFA